MSVRLCRLSKSFGYLNKDGFCSGTTCHVFAVVLGEFNVKMTSSVSTPINPEPDCSFNYVYSKIIVYDSLIVGKTSTVSATPVCISLDTE